MKKIIAGAILGAFIFTSNAQNFELIEESAQGIDIHHSLDETSFISTNVNAQSYIDFSKSHSIVSMKKGSPAMPYFTQAIMIPRLGKASLEVTHEGFEEFTNIFVLPSKGSLKRNVQPSLIPYTFNEDYQTDAFFPAQIAEIQSPYILRNTRGTTIKISPYQYNPVTKTLRVYKNVQVKVLTNNSEEGVNELIGNPSIKDVFMNIYKDHYLNGANKLKNYTAVDEEGDMLVISYDNFVAEMETFVRWKNQSGIKTTIVGHSAVGNSDTDIKSYIENQYQSNPDLKYILLVGDHGQIPSHTYGNNGEELWSDSYYGQMSNDFYPELFVGRFSGGISDIRNMVSRTLEYEQTPASGDWMTRAIGLASDEGAGYGDDGEADWQHARNMRTELLDFGYTQVYEFYDGSQGGQDASGNPSSTAVSNAVNDGIGLFNYTGHGDLNTCITGNYSSYNINSATNTGKYPFVISVACNNGTFTSGTCISETWLRATHSGSPSGAIASCGSSILMAWAPPMETQDEIVNLIANSSESDQKITLGGLFYNGQMSMMESYNSNATAEEVMQTWVFFGDPSTVFRNKETQNLTANHIGNVPLGTASLNVNCNTENALISISQNNVFLGKALVSGGQATVNFPSLVSNLPLTVVASKQNFAPYFGSVTVADGPAGLHDTALNEFSLYPNPSEGTVTVEWNSPNAEFIQIKDLTGKIVYQRELNINATKIELNLTELTSGIYLIGFNDSYNGEVKRIVIK